VIKYIYIRREQRGLIAQEEPNAISLYMNDLSFFKIAYVWPVLEFVVVVVVVVFSMFGVVACDGVRSIAGRVAVTDS
jgi:hypothetical protein